MIIVNFGHPITDAQKQQLRALLQQEVEVRDVPFHVNMNEPLPPQVRQVVTQVGLTPAEWQTKEFVIVLPGLSVGTGIVISEIAGRCGYLPSIVQLRQIQGVTPPQFEIAAVLNLQSIRDEARLLRFAE